MRLNGRLHSLGGSLAFIINIFFQLLLILAFLDKVHKRFISLRVYLDLELESFLVIYYPSGTFWRIVVLFHPFENHLQDLCLYCGKEFLLMVNAFTPMPSHGQ